MSENRPYQLPVHFFPAQSTKVYSPAMKAMPCTVISDDLLESVNEFLSGFEQVLSDPPPGSGGEQERLVRGSMIGRLRAPVRLKVRELPEALFKHLSERAPQSSFCFC